LGLPHQQLPLFSKHFMESSQLLFISTFIYFLA
jgi:hypothetical protein